MSTPRPIRPTAPGMQGILVADLIEDVLTRGLQVRMSVTGFSMAPNLCSGDIVMVEPLADREIRLGDLIVFRGVAGNLVLHRVLRRWRDKEGRRRAQTRGDANLHLDTAIPIEKILGRVYRIEKGDTRVIDLNVTSERLRALAIAGRNLMVSGVYYKLRLRPRRWRLGQT